MLEDLADNYYCTTMTLANIASFFFNLIVFILEKMNQPSCEIIYTKIE